jgi:hypothetical protein
VPVASARGRGGLLVGLLAVLLCACGAPAPAPAPTATTVPQRAPTPTVQVQPTADLSGASPSDVENAFLSNVDDLIAEASDLTVSTCEDLTQLTRDNPNLMPSLRGFTAAMRRVANSQSVLNTDSVKLALGDLDHTMGELEGALKLCGITQS